MKILETWVGDKVKVPFTGKEWSKFLGVKNGEDIAQGLRFLWEDGQPLFLQPPHNFVASDLLREALGVVGLSPEKIEFVSIGDLWRSHNESKRGDPDPWKIFEKTLSESLAETLLLQFHGSLIESFVSGASWWKRGRRRRRLRRFRGMIKFIAERSLERSFTGLSLPKRNSLFESLPLLLNGRGDPIPFGLKEYLEANLYAVLFLEQGFTAAGEKQRADCFRPLVDLFRLGNHPVGLADAGRSFRLLTL